MKKKFFITTTVAGTLFFFRDQPHLWNKYFDVCAISGSKSRLETFAALENIRFKYLPLHRNISPISDFMNLLRYTYFFLKERPTVVHGNTPKASLLSMIAAWLTRRPVRIYMCHGLRYQSSSGKLKRLLMLMERLSCCCSTHVICVSDGVKEQLIGDGLCRKDKVRVVRYGTAGGVDFGFFSRQAIENPNDVRNSLNISFNDFVFIFIGRMVGDKGINELVSAFDRLSKEYGNIQLLLLGGEDENQNPLTLETHEIIKSNERIWGLGRKNDVRPFLAAANALVLPSYREGVGMALIEANAMDVPCIASDIIGCRDVLKSGVNGELVAPRNTEELYKKMKDWVKEKDKVKMMSDRCREFVLSRYSKEDVVNSYLDEYLKIVNESE